MGRDLHGGACRAHATLKDNQFLNSKRRVREPGGNRLSSRGRLVIRVNTDPVLHWSDVANNRQCSTPREFVRREGSHAPSLLWYPYTGMVVRRPGILWTPMHGCCRIYPLENSPPAPAGETTHNTNTSTSRVYSLN